MKTLLVTGGSGFIGSNFIHFFLKNNRDWKILNFDKLTYCGNPENNRDLEGDPRYEFVKADICDAKAVRAAMEKAQGVIHFAAETHVDRSIDNPNDFLMTNVFGTRVLLEAAMQLQVPRYLHVSTDEVYGSLEQGSADENAPLAPSSPYSAAKAAGDLLVMAYRKTYGFPAMIARSSNNYGPFQFPEKVIPLFVTNLMEGKKVPLYGKGLNRRDWIYVEDNCRALALVFEKGKDGEIYNIGSGHEMTNLELTQALLKAMQRKEDSIRYVEDRAGHDFRYSVNTAKIRALGFKPEWNFERGLATTLVWYQDHPDWWGPLKRDKFTLKS